MYKLIDLQGVGTMETRRFKTKKDIVEALASYHDIDFTGCLEDDNETNIYEYLEQFKTIQEKLDYLLQYGEWEIEEI
jgi:hypothetical protein